MPIHCFPFEIQIIKDDFMGPMSYRVFGETAPGFLIPGSIFQVDPSPGYQAFDNFESILTRVLTIFFNEYEANNESINAVQ